jgi:hypothetical protein
MVTARGMNKLLKKGTPMFLAVVRNVGEIGAKEKKKEKKRAKGKMSAVSKLDKDGPRKDFASVEQFRQEILNKVDGQYREQLRDILMEFKDVFPEKLPAGTPPKREVELSIREQEGAAPPTRPPYRLSPAEQAELEEQIQDLLAQGFIRPSVSPYGAPILFVPKKDGRWRMCVDYRALNKQTIKDKFPLPRIDELLERLGQAKVFSALDLASGYHQIRVEQNSIERTAFRTTRGHYEFLVMPFGLTNAPSVFQRLMNRIFAEELGIFVLVYLDDILIFSKSIEEHWQHLRVALARLREAKLYGRIHKCSFLRDQVEYLGFDISREGIKPSDSKIEAILNWPTPENPRDVLSFLGLCSFYRRFVRGFSNITAPLTELTKEKKQWQWREDQEELAFQQMKIAMTTAPVLLFPDFHRQFVLTTDASLVAVGGILQQDQGQGLQPLAYASKKLNNAEVRYSAYERELLGIVWAIGQWRHFVEGRKFVVQTDHSSLRYLPNQAAVHRRIWKWVGILQGYDIDIQHIPGRKNPADALTRRHAQTDKKISDAVKDEDSRLVRFLQVPENASDEDIQKSLDQIFSRSRTQDPVLSTILKTSGIESAPVDPVCAIGSSTVTISSQFQEEMLKMLETETPYSDIIQKIDEAPLTNQVVQEGTAKYRIRGHSLCIHQDGFEETGSYWRIIVPDDKEVKAKLLTELHAVPYSGHPGYNRTLELARRHWFWKGMAGDIRDFVIECPVCQVEKGESQRSRGELQNLKIPEQRWTEISMDFITKMPTTTGGNDSILVVIDRATKMCHLVACSESISAAETAWAYWANVGKLHGIPKALHTDRDPRFTSRFWKTLWQITGTSLRFSTAYHPQTQGQVERLNAVIEQVLRCTVHQMGEPRDWDNMLATIEFCLNSQVNRSTGYTPFYLCYGHHPVSPMMFLSDTDRVCVENVSRFTRRLDTIYHRARSHLQAANEKYKARYDRLHRPAQYHAGTWVLLSTRHLRLQGTPGKLQRRFVGPFRVASRIGTQAYRLELPDTWKIHDVFHISLLKPWREDTWREEIDEQPVPVLEQDEDVEFEIERVLRWRYYKSGNLRKKEYLVVWKGYPLDDSTWLPGEDIRPKEHFENMIARDEPVQDTGEGSSG